MPEFPRAHSSASLTTQKPRADRNDADYRSDAAVRSKQDASFLASVKDTTVKWNDAVVTSQVNAFKAQKGIFMADVKSRAQLDPDQNNANKYIKEIDDYNKRAFNGMSEQAKLAAGAELFVDSEVAKIQINGVFQKKVIVEGVKNLTTSIEGYKQEVINTGNASELGKSYVSAMQTIDVNVATNVISPDEGKRLKAKFVEEVRTGLIDRDLYGNPEGFKKNIANYKFKDEKERSDKLAKADGLIKAAKTKADWEEQQINTLGCYDLSNALLNKTLSHDMIVNMYDRGMIDSETATIFDEIVVNGKIDVPDTTKTGKPDFFFRLLEEAGDDKTAALDVMKHAAKAYSGGGMGFNQYAYFINKANKKLGQAQQGKNWGDAILQGATAGLKGWIEAMLPAGGELASNALMSYVDKLQKGDEPEVAKEKVIEEVQKATNPNRSNYEIGQIVDTPMGAGKVVGFDSDGEPLVQRVK